MTKTYPNSLESFSLTHSTDQPKLSALMTTVFTTLVTS